MRDLDQIIERLDRHRQPATYGAVAGVVGRHPRTLMQGRPRSPQDSWIVRDGEFYPTGYDESELHPDLRASIEAKGVIATSEELDDWLQAHP
jgi:hypothetical protein